MKCDSLIMTLDANTIIDKITVHKCGEIVCEYEPKTDALEYMSSKAYKWEKHYKVLNIHCTAKNKVWLELLSLGEN